MATQKNNIISCRRTRLVGSPPVFANDAEAIAWGYHQNVFASHEQARETFERLWCEVEERRLYTSWMRLVGRIA